MFILSILFLGSYFFCTFFESSLCIKLFIRFQTMLQSEVKRTLILPTLSNCISFDSSLSFPKLKTEHSGNYTCIASNAAAKHSQSATLVVNGEKNKKNKQKQKLFLIYFLVCHFSVVSGHTFLFCGFVTFKN